MAPALRLLALVCTASALVVRDGGELKAALANGAPAIAQRHRVRQSGSKHGGARRVFSRPLTPLVTKFRGSSSSAD